MPNSEYGQPVQRKFDVTPNRDANYTDAVSKQHCNSTEYGEWCILYNHIKCTDLGEYNPRASISLVSSPVNRSVQNKLQDIFSRAENKVFPREIKRNCGITPLQPHTLTRKRVCMCNSFFIRDILDYLCSKISRSDLEGLRLKFPCPRPALPAWTGK